MKYVPLAVAGSFHIEIEPHTDDRGFFARAWCGEEMREHGCEDVVAQINISSNLKAGTLRGLHVQAPPHAEAKVFRCISGRTHHKVVDLRIESPTYGAVSSVELSAKAFDALYVPPYCATGYQALEDGATVLYAVSSPHRPGTETGIRWNDPGLGLEWPLYEDVLVSERDTLWSDSRITREDS